MRIGSVVRIVNFERSKLLGTLQGQVACIVNVKAKLGGVRHDVPVFWLIEPDVIKFDKRSAVIRRLGGWTGVAIGEKYLRVIG